MHDEYGGFPGPVQLLLRLFRALFPGLERRLVRTVTLPRTQTLQSAGVGTVGGEGKLQRYLTFDAVVGRNSRFHLLTDEHLRELGGVEFRALTALLWIVGGVGHVESIRWMPNVLFQVSPRVATSCIRSYSPIHFNQQMAKCL